MEKIRTVDQIIADDMAYHEKERRRKEVIGAWLYVAIAIGAFALGFLLGGGFQWRWISMKPR